MDEILGLVNILGRPEKNHLWAFNLQVPGYYFSSVNSSSFHSSQTNWACVRTSAKACRGFKWWRLIPELQENAKEWLRK